MTRPIMPSASILFARPDFDVRDFEGLFARHWGEEAPPAFEADQRPGRYAARLADCLVVLEAGVRPYDDFELLTACGNTPEDALKETFAGAAAFVRVTVAPASGGVTPRQAALVLTSLVTTLATLEGALCAACARRLLTCGRWLEGANALAQGRVPVELLVHAGVWEAGENRFAGFTSGLDAFGSPELEIRPSPASPEACGTLLKRLAGYVIETGRGLKAGDRVAVAEGRTAELEFAPSLVLEGETTLQFTLA